jgi:Heme NO binding associated
MELKGQMVFCPESDSLLFVASPFLDGLEGLTSRGLYISDIPIHDATRDVILVGEQSRAQVSNSVVLCLHAVDGPHIGKEYSAFQPLSRGPNISFALDAIQTLVRRRLININQRTSACVALALCTYARKHGQEIA